MFNSIRAELYKLRKSNCFKILLLIIVLASIGFLFMLEFANNFNTSSLPEGVTVEVSEAIQTTGYHMFYGVVTDVPTVVLFVSIFVGIFVCDDFTQRTIGIPVAAGKSKLQLLLAKIIVCFLVTVIFTSIYFLSLVTGGSIVWGFGVSLNSAIISELFINYLLTLVIQIGLASIVIMVAMLTKHTGFTIGAGIAVLMVLSIVIGVFDKEPYQVWLEWIPIYQVKFIQAGEITLKWGKILISNVGIVLLTSLLSYTYFQKKELK